MLTQNLLVWWYVSGCVVLPQVVVVIWLLWFVILHESFSYSYIRLHPKFYIPRPSASDLNSNHSGVVVVVVWWWWCGGGGGVVFITDNNTTLRLHWVTLGCGN